MPRAVLLALAVLLIAAVPADAYSLGGKKWRTRTITYHANAPQYADAIRAATAAWNSSGVRIRFKAVSSRKRAQVRIVYGRTATGPSGDAHLGYYRKSRVRLNRFDPTGQDPGWLFHQMRVVVAHELGHVLGLKHVKGPCSIMNYGRTEKCSKPPVAWQLRCRLLEPDDLRGAIRRYGGRAKPFAPEFCDFAPPPVPPAGLVAAWDPATRSVQLAWTNADNPYVFAVQWVITKDTCATAPTGAGAVTQPGPGQASNPTSGVARGNYCVAMWTQDRFDRLAGPTNAWVAIP